MRVRGTRRVALVAAGVVVATVSVAANGGTSSSGGTIDRLDVILTGGNSTESPARADVHGLQRHVYGRMNLHTEQLRRELSKAKPDHAVVAELEAKLRTLASEL